MTATGRLRLVSKNESHTGTMMLDCTNPSGSAARIDWMSGVVLQGGTDHEITVAFVVLLDHQGLVMVARPVENACLMEEWCQTLESKL
jgi:hypothetical protein